MSLNRSACAGLLALFALACMDPCLGREEGRISCLLIGSVQSVISPLPTYFTEDPLFTFQSDPHQAGLSIEERLRLDRLYFPRTRQKLVEDFDMVFFEDPYIDHFTPTQWGNLHYAFTQAGIPSLWSFGPAYGLVVKPSVLEEILPISDHQGWYHRPWHAVFERDRDPVFLPFVDFGMERVLGAAYAEMQPRQGSVLWAKMQPLNLPFIVSWRPGGSRAGLTWVFGDEFDMAWWGVSMSARGANPYGLDMMVNLILYSLDRPLIRDILARREARRAFSGYRAQKLVVLSMLEWADRFGANTFALSQDLTDLDAKMTAARISYLREEYETSYSVMSEVWTEMIALGEKAVRIKDQALMWVFLSEWLVVTASSILTGLAVWSLMIRRRLYREVGATRSSL